MKSIVALTPGVHPDSEGVPIKFTDEDLKGMASSYDVDLHEAPIVIGHPKHNAPAYGWVKAVKFDGEKLSLHADQVNPDFAEMNRSGAFKKHSISLYPPDDPRNPKPGNWYVRHIGFLGAQPPAIKGLPNTEFADGDRAVEIEFSEIDGQSASRSLGFMLRRLRDFVIDKFNLETADRAIPEYLVEDVERALDPPSTESPSPAQFSEGTDMSGKDQKPADDLAAREQQLKDREAKIEQREAQARRTSAVEFAETLVAKDAMRILPRHKERVAEILFTLENGQPQPIEFAEGDQKVKKSPAEAFREFLSELPVIVDFKEKSGTDVAVTGASQNIVVPAGALVDPDRAELYGRAKAYQRQHNCDFSEAVAAVEHQ